MTVIKLKCEMHDWLYGSGQIAYPAHRADQSERGHLSRAEEGKTSPRNAWMDTFVSRCKAKEAEL
ncbi:hypothetical protein ACTXT7_011036 [Hymenolepis weldensis]